MTRTPQVKRKVDENLESFGQTKRVRKKNKYYQILCEAHYYQHVCPRQGTNQDYISQYNNIYYLRIQQVQPPSIRRGDRGARPVGSGAGPLASQGHLQSPAQDVQQVQPPSRQSRGENYNAIKSFETHLLSCKPRKCLPRGPCETVRHLGCKVQERP